MHTAPVIYVGYADQKPKKDLQRQFFLVFWQFAALKYLTHHIDGYMMCYQPDCHYLAPVLGGIKTNAMW